jgi:hypothetical protein
MLQTKIYSQRLLSFLVNPKQVSGRTLDCSAYEQSFNDGDLVDTFSDTSGNGFNFTSTGANRPTFKKQSLGGNPGLLFSGTNFMNAAFTLAAPFTLFVVVSPTSVSARSIVIDTPSRLVLDTNAVLNNFNATWTSNGVVNCLTPQPDKICYTLLSSTARTLSTISKNTRLFDTFSGGTFTRFIDTQLTLGQRTNGSGTGLVGYVHRVIVYNSELNSKIISGIQNFLKFESGLTK